MSEMKQEELLERYKREEAMRLGRDVGQEKYRATDPANKYIRCNCQRDNCWTNGLFPLRTHMAALYRAIVSIGYSGRFLDVSKHDDPWSGVIYALQMAGGLDDLSTDPAYANDDDAGFYCESAADREDEDRELASKYTAALVMFNFAWTAYEAAIETSLAGMFEKDKLPVRARKILADEHLEASKISALDVSYVVARKICSFVEPLKEEIDFNESRYGLSGPPAAAELVRIFRNHIVHGREILPVESVAPCYRFYSVTRVLLLLIQYLVLRRVSSASKPVLLSANRTDLGKEPADLMLRNLHYLDHQWRTKMPKPRRFVEVR